MHPGHPLRAKSDPDGCIAATLSSALLAHEVMPRIGFYLLLRSKIIEPGPGPRNRACRRDRRRSICSGSASSGRGRVALPVSRTALRIYQKRWTGRRRARADLSLLLPQPRLHRSAASAAAPTQGSRWAHPIPEPAASRPHGDKGKAWSRDRLAPAASTWPKAAALWPGRSSWMMSRPNVTAEPRGHFGERGSRPQGTQTAGELPCSPCHLRRCGAGGEPMLVRRTADLI